MSSLKSIDCIVAIVLFVAVEGCSKSVPSDRPALLPVTGRVTFAGRPAEGVTVSLLPAAGGTATLIPTAVSGPDGAFQIGTFGTGDGAPEGEYSVTCAWFQGGANADSGEVDRLKGRYTNPARSPFKVRVQPGTNEPAKIDLK